MAWGQAIAQTAGNVGNDYGRATDANIDTALKVIQQKLMMSEVQSRLKEQDLRMKQMQTPQFITFGTPGGGTSGTMTDPMSGAPVGTPKVLAEGRELPAPKTADQMWYDARTKELGHPPPAQEIFDYQVGRKQAETPPKKVEIKAAKDVPYAIIDESGHSWDVNDPKLPPELKTELTSYRTAAKQSRDEAAAVESRKNSEMISRMLLAQDLREKSKGFNDLLTTAKRGAAGHSFLFSIEKEVAAAQKTPGQTGTTAGDRIIAEGFMQLMFGADPKALRGSPQMMQQMLQQGGFEDRIVAQINGAINGGKLSQDVRQQILEASQRQISSWDSTVTTVGTLSDDPKARMLVQRYQKAVGATSAPSNPVTDLSDLGGKKKAANAP